MRQSPSEDGRAAWVAGASSLQIAKTSEATLSELSLKGIYR